MSAQGTHTIYTDISRTAHTTFPGSASKNNAQACMICDMKHKSIPFYPLRFPPWISWDVQISHSEIFLLLTSPLEIPSQPTKAVYGYKDLEVTSNPWIIPIFTSVKNTAISWLGSSIAEKFGHLIVELVWVLRKVSPTAEHTREYKLFQMEGTDPKAAWPTALKTILGDPSLPVWRQGQHIGGGTEIKPPDSQKSNLTTHSALGQRTIAAADCLGKPRDQRTKALLITAIIIISIVPSSPGHGPVPHCVSQCANREEKNGPCLRNTEFKY